MQVRLLISPLFCLLSFLATVSQAQQLTDSDDRINYAIGHQIGSDFKRQNKELMEQAIRRGMQDGYSGNAPAIDRQEMSRALGDLKRNITEKMKADALKRIQDREKDEQQKRSQGEAFMLENESKEGVVTLESGLQYKVLKPGSGLSPTLDDQITFHYRARTLAGKEYDSSYKRGNPLSRRAGGILPGFSEAIQLMKPGSKWELYLPPELAYGREGPLAHQTVIIELELLSVDQQAASQ